MLVDSGQDPRELDWQQEQDRAEAEATARAEAVTFGEAWAEYMARGKPKKKEAWKPRYLADMQKMASRGGEPKKRGKGLTLPGPIALLLGMRLKDITPAALKAWHAREAKRGATQAARAVQVVSGFLRWCGAEDAYEQLVDATAARDSKVQDQLPPGRRHCSGDGPPSGEYVGAVQAAHHGPVASLPGAA